MTDLKVPEQWESLVPQIQKTRGTVMVIGAPDSGKTTLTKYLVRELSRRGEAVAYIDGDVGQSILGPPTTQAMAVFEEGSTDLEKALPGGVYFVGSVSPRGHRLETVVGLKRLLDKSQDDRTRIAIVDTTGYVTGEDALELKYQKIDLLEPRHIVAIQQAREIEPIIRAQEDRKRAAIYRIPSPSAIRTRSPEERRRYRWKRFREYFRRVRLNRFDLRRVILTGSHRFRISERRQDEFEGLILGLNGPDNFLLALGILETLDRAKAMLCCLVPPVAELDRVRIVRLGSMRIDLSEEMNGERFLGID